MWPSTWTSQPPQSTPHGMCGLQLTAPSDLWRHLLLANKLLMHSWSNLPNKGFTGIPVMDNIHLCQYLHNNQINKLYPFPIATLRLLSYAGQLLYLSKFHLCSILKIALNNICLSFKYLVHLQSKNHQYNQYPCHTNNILLFQNQWKQQLYLLHIMNFKQQPQKLLAWTSKPWKTGLMLLLRRSLRIWLHV